MTKEETLAYLEENGGIDTVAHEDAQSLIEESEVRLRMSPKTIGLINEVAELMGCSRGEAAEKLIADNVNMAKYIMKLEATLALERAKKKSEV